MLNLKVLYFIIWNKIRKNLPTVPFNIFLPRFVFRRSCIENTGLLTCNRTRTSKLAPCALTNFLHKFLIKYTLINISTRLAKVKERLIFSPISRFPIIQNINAHLNGLIVYSVERLIENGHLLSFENLHRH